MTFVAREGDAEGESDSAKGVTSLCTSCGAKASKGAHRGCADAVHKVSPDWGLRYPVRGVVCPPEPTKCSAGSWSS